MTRTSRSLTIVAIMIALTTFAQAYAQDTCKTFSIKNPHGAAMSIMKIWAVDSVNFTVSTVKPLPFQIGATESFDIIVCIRARDGKPHSTSIRYTNTHGTSSYNVTMTAPSVSAVPSEGDGADVGVRVDVSPNPASTQAMIDVDARGARETGVRLYDINGRVVWSYTQTITQAHIPIDLQSIPAGMYTLVADDGNGRRHARRLIVNR